MSRTVEIRPHKGGWQCFESKGVEPYWTGKDAKNDAIHYAKERAKSEGVEIRVLNERSELEQTLRYVKDEFRAL